MRLFLAVRLSEELASSVTAAMHELKQAGVKGRYTPTQNLHLTLAFLGEADAAAVRRAMQDVAVSPFRLSLSGMGNFGDLLWVGVKGNQGLAALVKRVRAALDAAGIGYDRKPFAPHITVVRAAAGNWRQAAAPQGSMTVKTVSLMKSERKDGRQVYTEIASF